MQTRHSSGSRSERSPGELVADVSALLAPPVVCTRIHDSIHSPSSSAEHIAKLVALDPALTVRLLKIVNSSFYAFSSSMEDIGRAVTILGTRELYTLAVVVSAVRSFSGLGAGLIPFDTFWHHSIFVSLLARELARRLGVPDPSRLFLAGFLHDIGSPVIYMQLPELVAELREEGRRDEESLHAAELERLGFTHADVGCLLLETWPLPVSVRSAVQHHHDLASTTDAGVEAALLRLADQLAAAAGRAAFCPETSAAVAIDAAVWEILGLHPDELSLDAVVDVAKHQFTEVVSTFLPE